jgi:aerotolerance regulator-like protein/VWA domain-containing protein
MFPTTALFGFDLLSPSMLGWLAAAAAPLLIHLWSRRRYQEIPWAAMQYLLAAMKAARRRTRLEQWLLLLIRTAIIITVVMAAAEPYLELGTVPFMPGVRTHRVFLLDGSYSMGYRPEEASRFEAAKELMSRVVDESNQGDGFSLVLMSDPARAVVGEPSFAPREFLAEIDALGQPQTGADLAGAVAHVERLVEDTKRRHPKLTRQEIYVLTDFGRTAWGTESLGRSRADLVRRRFQKISESAELHLIDLGQNDAENVAVSNLRTEQAFTIRGRNLAVRAEIQSYARSTTNQTVQLVIDGRRAAEEQVRLDPEGSATVAFYHRFETPGDHTLEVVAPGDRLEIDNRRWLAISVKPSLRVLCIDGQPGGDLGAASDFLAYALSPYASQSPTATILPEVAGESALLELDLHQYDCLFLVNVAQFTNSEARVLEGYLEAGGGIVFFLGDRVMADRYNQVLGGATPEGVDLLPARLAGETVSGKWMINPLEYRHPIVGVFRGQERAGLLTTPIKQCFPLEVPEDSASRTVLALDDGTPLVVERQVHRGRVILVGTSADVSWTPMPVLPSYVPVVQELLAFAVAEQLGRRNVWVGESIGATQPRIGGSTSVTIETPDGRNETTPLVLEGGAGTWSFAATDLSGIYVVAPADDPETGESFAVNVDTAEGNLAKTTEADLRQGVLADVNLQLHTDWQRMADEPAKVTTRSSGSAKALLYLLLALLFAETYLARRFGHHR